MSLEAVRFVFAPGAFPRRLDFFLVQDEQFIPETLVFLRAFAPAARFLGYVPSDVSRAALGEGEALVVSSRDWEKVVGRLLDHGIEAERVVVLINPDDDIHGWLVLGRSCLDHLREVADPRVPLRRKVGWLREYLRVAARVSFEGGRPVWDPNCYFHPYQDKVQANLETIREVEARLADKESRDVWNLVLYGTPEEYLQHFLTNAFFHQQYTDLILLGPGDNIVNAGIASGWDIPFFQSMTLGRGRHILLEPSDLPEQFRRAPFEPLAYALWDREDTLSFKMIQDNMLASDRPVEKAANDTARTVQCLPLDRIVSDLRLDRVDLIKMDIEGAEPRTLEGMRDTLVTRRPQLALAIYHEAEHMWTLPAALMELLPHYKFFVRLYSASRFECLLYAIPEERFAQTKRRKAPNTPNCQLLIVNC